MNFGTTPEAIENQRKRLLLYASAGLGSLSLGVFCIISFIQGRHLLAVILLAFLSVVFFCAYLAKVLTRVQPVCLFLGAVLFLLASYLLLGGGANGTGAYWTYAITMLMLLLVGPKMGVLYMTLYLLINSLALHSSWTFVYPYSEIDTSRIIATSLTLYGLILAGEWIRVGSYSAISSTSESHRAQASTDPLTGISNRLGVLSCLKSQALDTPCATVIIDVDNFKDINDRYGHDFGDRVLVKLAETLQKYTKGRDIVGRWGGEEFLVILLDTTLESAAELIGKIKDSFYSDPLSKNGESVPVSFSAGIASLGDHAEFEAVVRTADSRLYLAKEFGRNRVVYADNDLTGAMQTV